MIVAFAVWSDSYGPLFRDIWPLDARLRSGRATHNLVLMALECEGAFPEAVDTIIDVIVPYDLSNRSLAEIGDTSQRTCEPISTSICEAR
jgi:hypothetical protein